MTRLRFAMAHLLALVLVCASACVLTLVIAVFARLLHPFG